MGNATEVTKEQLVAAVEYINMKSERQEAKLQALMAQRRLVLRSFPECHVRPMLTECTVVGWSPGVQGWQNVPSWTGERSFALLARVEFFPLGWRRRLYGPLQPASESSDGLRDMMTSRRLYLLLFGFDSDVWK